jgi:hypothetical protein
MMRTSVEPGLLALNRRIAFEPAPIYLVYLFPVSSKVSQEMRSFIMDMLKYTRVKLAFVD